MKSLLIKGSLVLSLAAVFGMPNASAAPLVAVEPTVAVVDGNHAAIVGANGLLNAFIQIILMQLLLKLLLMLTVVKLSMMLKALMKVASMS